MSKINAARIVNLNYNKNTMKVNDETFELAGESTLMSLRNGGGKTVMVQMIMAPFVNARYRDLKDRKFENYFISQTPTYILVEWLLDNNSSYVLVGMGIKRSSASPEEDYRNVLDIFTFIHEYKQGNKYDIHNFPVTEKTEKGFKVRSFSNIKKIMDDIKTNREYVFDYFDLGVDSQRRKYFDTLKQYHINNREWESIIKRINLKESGLSDLFQDAKTISGLVEKWFLPTVEDKLNDKDDKIKNFQDIMKKFVYQYKENECKIVRKNGIEDFKVSSLNILKAAEEFRSVKQNTENIKNDMANLYRYLESQIISMSEEKSTLELKLSSLHEELEEIEFERLSFEYHELSEEIEKLAENERELKELIERCEIQIKGREEEIALQECAKLFKEYKDASRNVQLYENKLDSVRAKDEEKQQERNNLGFTLRKVYEDIIENQRNEMTLKTREKQDKEKLIDELKVKEDQLNSRVASLIDERSSLKTKVEAYNKEENDFIKKYNQVLKRNIMGEYDQVVLDSYKNKFDERVNKAEKEYGTMLKEQESVRQELPLKRKQHEEERIRKTQLDSELETAKKELEVLEKSIEEIRKILMYSSIEESRIFDKDYVLKQLARKIESLKISRDNLARDLDRLEMLNIRIVFGLEWLKKQNLTQDKKEELIRSNPFLPYSLIMSSSNLDKLKLEDVGVFTSFPLPIIEQERLENNLEVKVANKIYTLGNINFFISFNRKILNEQELKKLTDDLSRRIEELKERIGIQDKEIDKYTGDKKSVEDFNIRKVDTNSRQRRIAEIEDEIEEVNSEIS